MVYNFGLILYPCPPILKETIMKKIDFLFILSTTILVFNTNCLFAKETTNEELKLRPEKEVNENSKKEEEHKIKELTFRAKISDLWFKHENLNDDKTLEKKRKDKKDTSETVDISLLGEFYKTPIEVHTISKKKVDRNTIEGLTESVFSAMREGNLKWIAENYVDEEKQHIKDVFKNKNDLKAAKLDFESITTEHLVGHAIYKDYTLIFIEQEYNIGKKLIETIACKQTIDGWKMTNALGNDKTFDIVFAAVALGQVLDGDKVISKNTPVVNPRIIPSIMPIINIVK